ncbi:MAG TPA: RecX family transcriptional regulator [Bryobacteraceae bacterium]|nr:RecX family transcriptional regulator [Bryobacteraceae bacterium]
MVGGRAPKKVDADGLWAYSLKLLGGRAMSTGEVRQKLVRRAEKEADIETTISKLREYGYLNDTQFAESFAAGRRDNEGFGRMRVLRDLRQRRVAPNLATEAVEQAFEGTDETARIEAFLERKYRNVNLGELLQEDKKLHGAYRRLRYAGFSSGASIRVLKRFAAQAEQLEDEPEIEPEA